MNKIIQVEVAALPHENGIHYYCLCPNWQCGSLLHWHGANYGHRVAHCDYRDCEGYTLVPANDTQAELLRWLEKRSRTHPAWERLPYKRHRPSKRWAKTLAAVPQHLRETLRRKVPDEHTMARLDSAHTRYDGEWKDTVERACLR